MTGNRAHNVVLTSRDFGLFTALLAARVLDRDQVISLLGWNAIRRVNARLQKLCEAGYLRRWFLATEAGGQKAIYGLSPKSAELAGNAAAKLITWPKDTLITWNQFVVHQLALNWIWIRAQTGEFPSGCRCSKWLTFKFPISVSIPLMPDAYFEIETPSGIHPFFVEVDLGSESSTIWGKKISWYLQLASSGEFKNLFKHDRFRTLIAAPSERRLQNLRRAVLRQTNKIFWFSTLEEINQSGLWAPIWKRPEGNSKLCLL